MSDAERTPAKLAFGQLLRELRGSQKQSVFGARYGGYDRRAISAIESGVRAPKSRLLNPLCDAFPTERDRIERAAQQVEAEERERRAHPAARQDPVLARIRQLLRRGEIADARIAVRDALRKGRTADLLELAGDLEADHAKAAERYCEALATHNLSPSVMKLLRKRQFDRPIVAVETEEGQSLFKKRRDGSSVYDLAAAFYYCDAVKVRGTDPVASRLRVKIADKFWEAQQYRRALSTVSRYLTADRTSAELWLRRGRFLWYFGDYSGSYSSLTTALDLGAHRAAVLVFRGRIHLEWGDHRTAIEELTAGVMDPVRSEEKGDALAARAYALTLNGQTDEAMQDLAEAETLVRNSAYVSYHEGLVKWKQNDYLEAGLAFDTALGQDDDHLPYLREEHCRQIYEIVFEEWTEPHEKKERMRDIIIYSLYHATPETASPELRKRMKDTLDEYLMRDREERKQAFHARYVKPFQTEQLEIDAKKSHDNTNGQHE